MRYAGMGLPTFHGMGFFLQLMQPLVMATPIVVFTPQDPDPPIVPNPQNVFEVARLAQCNAFIAAPSFVEVGSLPDTSDDLT